MRLAEAIISARVCYIILDSVTRGIDVSLAATQAIKNYLNMIVMGITFYTVSFLEKFCMTSVYNLLVNI